MHKVEMLCLLLVCIFVGGGSGCASSNVDAQLHALSKTPPDFSVELFVDGLADSDDPRTIRSNYLLQPDHRLHLALGKETQKDSYPVRYLKLTFAQYEQLVQVTLQANLLAEPTSPYAEAVLKNQSPKDDQRPLLHLSITSWGKTNRYITTGKDSPPTQVLLDRMILYTGRQLPNTTLDAHRGY